MANLRLIARIEFEDDELTKIEKLKERLLTHTEGKKRHAGFNQTQGEIIDLPDNRKQMTIDMMFENSEVDTDIWARTKGEIQRLENFLNKSFDAKISIHKCPHLTEGEEYPCSEVALSEIERERRNRGN